MSLVSSLSVSNNIPSSKSFTSPYLGNPCLILPSVKASKLPLQISTKTTSFPIACQRDITTHAAATADRILVIPKESLGRHSFPPGFTFGAASAAYQTEGAWNEGGRGPSVWDTFCHEHPEKIADSSNGDHAIDSYHRYKDDVKLLKDMNMDAYRFSISWSRILPTGSLKGGINHDGIKHYHKLIDDLHANGIKPYVTLFHWDLPQGLQDHGGFANRQTVSDFKDFCNICFHEFGDKVKHWITLNEPWHYSTNGHGRGTDAPGRCSPIFGCSAGNSLCEPYTVTHNLILAHGEAVRLYKEKYQANQRGQIGITLDCFWYTPYNDMYQHKEAVNRLLDFNFGWYMDPLVYGDYPFTMKALVRERLPTFTQEESKMITNSFDFIGINYYTARFLNKALSDFNLALDLGKKIRMTRRSEKRKFILLGKETKGAFTGSFSKEVIETSFNCAEQLVSNGHSNIGQWTNGSWLQVYPEGIKELMLYIKDRYRNPPIYITENGYGDLIKTGMTKDEAIADKARKMYHELHLTKLKEAIEAGVDVKGYFAWSLTDSFEWGSGYTLRFGLAYVDYHTLERTPKDSAKWFSKILEKY
ncbi:hypothetical protein J5N97_012469 [Dioscorea zingiberensis]|uniref:Beta-glucosidase n=1 Tax=Dioscorea zingiberensis TaxID=325984 RepID=A0A9D5HHS1_9LILI|nr:hypothetical protein J5N97_012469 [Dioscorea zingiberensis]